MFATNEQGADLPVCTYVQVMRAGRLLDSPRHAARFVSLLPFERDDTLGAGRYVLHFIYLADDIKARMSGTLHTLFCVRKKVVSCLVLLFSKQAI